MPISARNSLKISFKLSFLNYVSFYHEKWKIKLLINVYIKISRNLRSNFFNFCNFFQVFSSLASTFPAFYKHNWDRPSGVQLFHYLPSAIFTKKNSCLKSNPSYCWSWTIWGLTINIWNKVTDSEFNIVHIDYAYQVRLGIKDRAWPQSK